MLKQNKVGGGGGCGTKCISLITYGDRHFGTSGRAGARKCGAQLENC